MNEKLKQEIKKSIEILRKGGVIVYPTDTIWGIGCDATNETAVKRIYEIKRRADSKSMLVLLDDVGKIASYADVPDISYELIEASDKPLTVIYPNSRGLAAGLPAEDGSIGIRITKEEFTRNLLFQFHKPIVSTSANVSGEPSPTAFRDISDDILNAVDYVVDYRREENGGTHPSSIIKFDADGSFKIIRK
ncbi:MAG: threonylcarbamoyl-AMP synthase [Culturomica sp.]|jgi:L-threonylcarbamoyladenylate synthase|nr:threonylcarbamoyl-AMP synthase [Culturomica sp.]